MKQGTVISSISNSRMKNLIQLQKKAKAREEQGIYVIEGLKMFEEARLAKFLTKAYFSESFYDEKIKEDSGFFTGLDYDVVTDSLYKDISDTKTPQGVMGIVGMAKYTLKDMAGHLDTFLLLLEDIRDPGNLGTMIRTAEGAGINGILLNSSCVDIYNPKVIRSTMGSIFRVPICQSEDFIQDIRKLKEQQIKIYAAHLSGCSYDTEGSFRGKCAILIGNEANGLSEEASNMAENRIKIPMAGKVESLNAAVAAAILMYEAARQRRN